MTTTAPDSISLYAYQASVIARLDAIRAHHYKDWNSTVRRLINSIPFMLEIELLKAMDDLLSIEPLQKRPSVVEILLGHNWEIIMNMSAHRQWLIEHPDDIVDFASTIMLVKDTFSPTPDIDGRFPTVEAHAEMENAYDTKFYVRGGVSYYQNEAVSRAVEDDPTCVQDLIAYLDEHEAVFDPKHFAEYRKHHSLKDGWL